MSTWLSVVFQTCATWRQCVMERYGGPTVADDNLWCHLVSR